MLVQFYGYSYLLVSIFLCYVIRDSSALSFLQTIFFVSVHLSLMASTEISSVLFIILHFKKHQRFSTWSDWCALKTSNCVELHCRWMKRNAFSTSSSSDVEVSSFSRPIRFQTSSLPRCILSIMTDTKVLETDVTLNNAFKSYERLSSPI